jgi:hypothetical protein
MGWFSWTSVLDVGDKLIEGWVKVLEVTCFEGRRINEK